MCPAGRPSSTTACERTASVGGPCGVVLEFNFPSRIIAYKQSMTDRRRARRAAGGLGRTGKGKYACVPVKPEQAATRRRPALVAAAPAATDASAILRVLMITSAARKRWPLDVPISNLRLGGLTQACVVRVSKVTTQG